MKFIILFICLVGAFGSFLSNKPINSDSGSLTSQNTSDFFIGGLVALKVTDSVPNGLPCITAVANLQTAVQTALALIRNNQLVEAADLLEQAYNATREACGAASVEGQKTFQDFIATITESNFVNEALARIGSNYLTILQNFQKGISNLNNQSFFNAGMEFGKIVQIILSEPNSDELVDFIVKKMTNLGAVNWPFTNCATSAPLQPSLYTLDPAPAKGITEVTVVRGTVNAAVSLKQVKIVTLLYGVALDTRYDAFTHTYQRGDTFEYRFSAAVPTIAPSVRFF